MAAWAGVRGLSRAPALGLPPTTARTSRGRFYFEPNLRPRLRLRRPAVVAVVTLLVRLRNGKVVPGPQSRAGVLSARRSPSSTDDGSRPRASPIGTAGIPERVPPRVMGASSARVCVSAMCARSAVLRLSVSPVVHAVLTGHHRRNHRPVATGCAAARKQQWLALVRRCDLDVRERHALHRRRFLTGCDLSVSD